MVSPLLANIYLHYVLDLWAERWRRRKATGDMIIVRYADDFVVGFQYGADARRFWDDMRKRFEEFSLSLNPDKTCLIEFGRFAAERRARRGLGKPETFNFLGFTFLCGKSRRGNFLLKRKTRRDRAVAKLKEVKDELRRRMHLPIPWQGMWLRQVVTGFYGYHAVPTNFSALAAFRIHVARLWRRASTAQSKGRLDVGTDREAGSRLPSQTPHPSSLAKRALCRQTPKVGAVCGKAARTDLCGGRAVMDVPTAILAPISCRPDALVFVRPGALRSRCLPC